MKCMRKSRQLKSQQLNCKRGNDPEILEIRDDNSIGKRGAYETDYFSRENENFSFIQ